jgi:hypothetical protein
VAITVSPVVATSGAATQAEHGGDEPSEAARAAPTSTRAAAVGAVVAGAVFLAVLLNGHLSLLQRPPAAEDFFDVQAHSLLHLRWDVPRSALFIEGFLVHGKIYEYFGPLPALIRLPVAAVTDSLDARLGQISMLLAFAVAMTFTIRLGTRLRPMVRGSAPVTRGERWAVGTFTFVVGAGSVLVVLAGRAWAYHEAEVWGVALALGAFEFVIAFTLTRRHKHLVLASALTTGALLSRTSVGLGPLAALGLLLLASLWPSARRLVGMRGDAPARSLLLLHVGAILVPIALYSYVNYAKFGTLFSVPFTSQLSKEAYRPILATNGGSMFGPKFVPTTALQYLRPDALHFSSLFPWVTFPPRESIASVGNVVVNRELTGSYPASMPLLTLLGVVGMVAVARPSRRRRPSLSSLRAPMVGGMVAAFATLTFASISHRYLSDFIPLGVLAALVGTHVVLRWTAAPPRHPVKAVAWTGLGLLVATSVWFNVGLGVVLGRAFFPDDDHALASFVAFQYDLHERFPGGPPPAVETGSQLPLPKHATAFVLGRCDALFWSDGLYWRPLERSEGGGRFRFRVRFPASPTGWEPLVVSGGDGRPQPIAVRVLPDNRVQFALGIFPGAAVPIRAGGSHALEVLMDATRGSSTEGTVSVTLDGKSAWWARLPNSIIGEPVRPLTDVTVGRSDLRGFAPRFSGILERLPAETALCRKLAPGARG